MRNCNYNVTLWRLSQNVTRAINYNFSRRLSKEDCFKEMSEVFSEDFRFVRIDINNSGEDFRSRRRLKSIGKRMVAVFFTEDGIMETVLFGRSKTVTFKGSFSCKRGFSLLNFERGLKKNYGLPNLETLCSYYSLSETATVLILCKNIESFLRYDCSKWDMLFSQR